MIMFTWGDKFVKTSDMTHGMKFNSEAKALGFHDGDILVGTELGAFKSLDADTYRALATAKRVDVLRNGQKVSLTMPGNLDLLDMIKSTPRFVDVFIPNTVDSVMSDSPAAKAGIKAGDKIVKFNDTPIASYNDFVEATGRIADVLASTKNPSDSAKALKSNHFVCSSR